jgi:hypothetical protein
MLSQSMHSSQSENLVSFKWGLRLWLQDRLAPMGIFWKSRAWICCTHEFESHQHEFNESVLVDAKYSLPRVASLIMRIRQEGLG